MNVNYTLQDIHFEWDNRKVSLNWRKHHVSFEQACEVFFDPFVCAMEDELINGELREAVIGMMENWQLLYVVFLIQGDTIRLISARFATRPERRRYEDR